MIMPEVLKIALWIIAGLAALTLLSGGIVYKVVFRTKRVSQLDPDRYPDDPIIYAAFEQAVRDNNWILDQNYEQPQLTAFDGVTLKAWLLTPDTPCNKFVICVHGHTSRGLFEFASISRMYRDAGFNVLVVDDRGHGASGGTISFSILDRYDVQLWAKYLAERFPCSEIFLHGISMGSATVTQCSCLELPKEVKGVIADCGFTSPAKEIGAVCRQFFMPPYPTLWGVDFWCRICDGYSVFDANSLKTLPNATLPILFIHGQKDTLVPPKMAERMYEVCAAPKRIVRFEEAIHARSFARYPEEYKRATLGFISDCLEGKL